MWCGLKTDLSLLHKIVLREKLKVAEKRKPMNLSFLYTG